MSIERLLGKRRITDGPDPCHEFTGAINAKGYGHIKIDGKTVRVHRYSYEQHKGPVPDGLMVLHRCNNRKCFNPEHLVLGTVNDNYTHAKEAGTTIRPNQRALGREQVLDIRQGLKDGIRPYILAQKHRVGPSTINHIMKGESYSDIQLDS